MVAQRHVRLFRNGRNQAVRIDREFELPGEDAILRQEDDRLVIEPAPPRSLLALLVPPDPNDDDFRAIDELAWASTGNPTHILTSRRAGMKFILMMGMGR